jgi:hypothetical protein
MLYVFESFCMQFLIDFTLLKKVSDRKPSQKRKKCEARQAHSCHNSTLFGCADLRLHGAMSALELLGYSAYSLSLIFPLLLLEPLLSPYSSEGLGVVVEQPLQ